MSLAPSPQAHVIKSRSVRGFSLEETIFAARSSIAPHAHSKALMCISLKGHCREHYGTKVREYKPLTSSYLPIEVVHRLDFPDKELRAFSIDVSPQWASRMGEASLSLFESVYCDGGIMANLFARLYREFHTADEASSLAIEGLAMEMLAEVSRQRVVLDRKPPVWLERVVDLLHSNFTETLKISSIADTVGVHPVHLAREFRKHYRCTVGEYIRQLRIQKACTALSKSDVSLSDIASAAGFADQSHFGRTFKQFTGMTPAAYRSFSSAR